MFSPDFQGMKKRGKKYRVKIEVALRIFHSSVQVLQNIGIFHSNQMQKCLLKYCKTDHEQPTNIGIGAILDDFDRPLL